MHFCTKALVVYDNIADEVVCFAEVIDDRNFVSSLFFVFKVHCVLKVYFVTERYINHFHECHDRVLDLNCVAERTVERIY